jgi:hypothetical protein
MRRKRVGVIKKARMLGVWAIVAGAGGHRTTRM